MNEQHEGFGLPIIGVVSFEYWLLFTCQDLSARDSYDQ